MSNFLFVFVKTGKQRSGLYAT